MTPRIAAAVLLLTFTARGQPAATIYSTTVTVPAGGREAVFGVFGQAFTAELLKQNRLEPSAAELAAAGRRMKLAREDARARQIQDQFVYLIIANFKLNRLLYTRHGGRVALSAFGTHLATDAWLQEMADLERQGYLRFHQPGFRRDLIDYLEQYRGDGVVQGARAREIFARPIWEAP